MIVKCCLKISLKTVVNVLWIRQLSYNCRKSENCLKIVCEFWPRAQIHKHCLTIYCKICPKIILRQKLWCHKIILWHVLSQFTKFVSADLGNLSLRFLEVDSNHSNCDIKVRSKCKVSKFISTRDKHTCLGQVTRHSKMITEK